jgi:hypothetical protein
VNEKFVIVRRWGQCAKCHHFRELRASWDDTGAIIHAVCDKCFNVPMDEEALDLIFEKAGVNGPRRHLVTAQSFVETSRDRIAGQTTNLERIFPEEDSKSGYIYAPYIPIVRENIPLGR